MKVAIVAGGHGKYDAPLGDKAWECWGLNAIWRNYNNVQEKFTRWFELHRKSFLRWEYGRGDDNAQFAFARALTTLPFYVQDVEEWPDCPTAKEFPWEDLRTLVPAFADYHACSIDWLIAYAIQQGATEIGLYGVEQMHSAEPISSRACVEFWSGVAVGRGITVFSVDNSTFKCAHLVYTRIPYALDPTWLPYEDRTEHRRLADEYRRLRLEVELDEEKR